MISCESVKAAALSAGFKLDAASAEFTLSLVARTTECPKLIHHNWFGPPLLPADRRVLELNLKRVAPLGGNWKFIMWLSPNFSSSPAVYTENSKFISSLSKRYNIEQRNIEDSSHSPKVLEILTSLWKDTQTLRQLKAKDPRFQVCVNCAWGAFRHVQILVPVVNLFSLSVCVCLFTPTTFV